MATKRAVGGPLDGQDIESRFDGGFLVVDKSNKLCWLYKASDESWVITPDFVGNEARQWDSELSRQAADGTMYDVRALDES